ETGGAHAAARGDTRGVKARGKREAFARRLTHYWTAPRRLIDAAWASTFAPRGVPPLSATPSQTQSRPDRGVTSSCNGALTLAASRFSFQITTSSRSAPCCRSSGIAGYRWRSSKNDLKRVSVGWRARYAWHSFTRRGACCAA